MTTKTSSLVNTVIHVNHLKKELVVVAVPEVIRVLLRVVQLPHSFVIVAQGWPSCFATVLELGLPLMGVFFPLRYHH